METSGPKKETRDGHQPDTSTHRRLAAKGRHAWSGAHAQAGGSTATRADRDVLPGIHRRATVIIHSALAPLAIGAELMAMISTPCARLRRPLHTHRHRGGAGAWPIRRAATPPPMGSPNSRRPARRGRRRKRDPPREGHGFPITDAPRGSRGTAVHFALCYVVLNVATAGLPGKSFYGLATALRWSRGHRVGGISARLQPGRHLAPRVGSVRPVDAVDVHGCNSSPAPPPGLPPVLNPEDKWISLSVIVRALCSGDLTTIPSIARCVPPVRGASRSGTGLAGWSRPPGVPRRPGQHPLMGGRARSARRP